MARQKTNRWSKEERIKEGKVIKEMADDLDINWETILNSYHITYNTAKQLIKEYMESVSSDKEAIDQLNVHRQDW